MDGINPAQAAPVQFQGNTSTKSNETARNPIEMKKDGKQKVVTTLACLAAIGAGVFLIAKKGKGKKAVQAVKDQIAKNSGNLQNKTNGELADMYNSAIKGKQNIINKIKVLTGELTAKQTELKNLQKIENPPEATVNKINDLQKNITELQEKITKNKAALEKARSVANDAQQAYINRTTETSFKLERASLDKKAQGFADKWNTELAELQSKTGDEADKVKGRITELQNNLEGLERAKSKVELDEYDDMYAIVDREHNLSLVDGYKKGLENAEQKIKDLNEKIGKASDEDKVKLQDTLKKITDGKEEIKRRIASLQP